MSQSSHFQQSNHLDCQKNKRTLSTFLVIVLFITNEAFMTAVVPVSPEILLRICYKNVHRSDCERTTQFGLWERIECFEDQTTPSYSSNQFTPWNTTTSKDVFTINQDFPLRNNKNTDLDPFYECHEKLSFQNGLLLATKFLMRLLLTVPATKLIEKVGLFGPFFFSTLLTLISCLIIGFADLVFLLFLSRALHGIGSTGLELSGINLLAILYQDDERKRGLVLGSVISAFACGTLIGPTLGSVLYGLVGQSAPFLVLSVVFASCLVCIPLLVPVDIRSNQSGFDGSSFLAFISNPYTLLVSGIASLTSLGLAYANGTLPIWIRSTFRNPEWQIGVVFIPTSAAHIILGPLVGYWQKTLKRWRCMFIGALVMVIGISTLPLAGMIWHLIPSMFLVGIATGTVDSTLIGIMYRIVDVWHRGAHSAAAAVFVFEFCLAYTLGTLTSGSIVTYIGFDWTMWSLAIAILISSPFCLIISRIPEDDKRPSEEDVLLPPCRPDILEDTPQLSLDEVKRFE